MTYTLASIGSKVDVLVERVANLKQDFNTKHSANVEINTSVDRRLARVEMKLNTLWSYMVAAGVATGIALKLIDHFWK